MGCVVNLIAFGAFAGGWYIGATLLAQRTRLVGVQGASRVCLPRQIM